MTSDSTTITTIPQFESEVLHYNGAGVIVVYTASWCPPCAPLLDHIRSTLAPAYYSTCGSLAAVDKAEGGGGGVRLMTVDVDSAEEGLLTREAIETVPHVVFYRPTTFNSKFEDQSHQQYGAASIRGARNEEISENIKSLYGTEEADRRSFYGGSGGGCSSNGAATTAASDANNNQQEDFTALDAFLSHLLKRDHIVLILTGTPSQPMCGFTGKLVELLRSKGATGHFTYFDIMTSDAVCDRLKHYSQWPTYPHVYVKGKLVGGLDICKELDFEGELDQTLQLK